MIEIGFLGAVLAGVLAILSPCSALLLPAFFAYAFQTRRELVRRTGDFLFGLLLVLIPMGAGAGGIGAILNQNRLLLVTIGGGILIVFGVMMMLGVALPLPQGPVEKLKALARGTNSLSVILLGAVYGFSGFCAGPLLGAVLTTAVVGGNAIYGALIMACYGIGMVIPLVILALVWDKLNIGEQRWLHSRWLGFIAGAIFVFIGVLFIFTDGTAALGSWLSTDTVSDIQTWVARTIAPVPNAVALLAVAIIAEVIVALRLFFTPSKAQRVGADDADEAEGTDADKVDTVDTADEMDAAELSNK